MELPKGARHRRSRRCGTHALAGMLCGALALAGCTVEPPSSSTSTNFDISIPVANDSTRIEELVSDRDDFLQIDPATGGMRLKVAVPLADDDPDTQPEILGSAEVGNNLRVTPQASSFATAIGNLSLPGQTIPEITVGFGDIVGRQLPAGETVPLVPAASFDTDVPLSLASVTSLSIVSGGLEVAVANDLPIAIENVRLALFDETAGAEVDVLDLGTLAAGGGSASGSFSLDDQTISGDLSVSVSGSTAQATDVTIGADDELRINAELRPLLVSQATALIPQQEFEDSQTLDFPDDRIQVTEAAMSAGSLTLEVTNNIPIIMEVELSLPDLRDAEGNAQSFLVDRLEFNQTRVVTFDLTDNVFAPVNPLQLRVGYRASTFASDTEVTIGANQEISVAALTEELVFSRVQGRLNEITLEVPEQGRAVDFPDGLDNINIATSDLEVYITSGVGFLADVDILFTGIRKSSGRTETLVVRETFERGNPDAPVSNVLDVSSSQLTDFLNFLPDSINVRPVVVVGDGEEEEIIETDHFVNLDSVVFRTESRLSIVQDTRIDPDVQDISFRDSELREKINTNFRSAKVTTELENSAPFGVGVRLMVARTREAVYDTSSPDFVIAVPRRDQLRFQVDAAPVDANGLSNGTSTSEIELELDREEVLKFILEDSRSDSLFSGVRVTLPRTDGEVEIRSTDFINVIAGLELELELNEDLLD